MVLKLLSLRNMTLHHLHLLITDSIYFNQMPTMNRINNSVPEMQSLNLYIKVNLWIQIQGGYTDPVMLLINFWQENYLRY